MDFHIYNDFKRIQHSATKLIICCFLAVILSCSNGNVNTHSSKIPLNKFMIDNNIDSTNIKYQYYQKFGFTDICEHIRILSKIDSIPNLANDLPISYADRNLINRISNKTDSIFGDKILINYRDRNVFSDIELDFYEFQSDSNLVLNLTNGKYQVRISDFESELIIYDNKNKLIYYEIHRCDGN